MSRGHYAVFVTRTNSTVLIPRTQATAAVAW